MITCSTNTFTRYDVDHRRSSRHTFNLLPYHFFFWIFASKPAVFYRLTHILTRPFDRGLARFLSYNLSHPFHIFFILGTDQSLTSPKQCLLVRRIEKHFFSREFFLIKAFCNKKIEPIRDIKRKSEFFCSSINKMNRKVRQSSCDLNDCVYIRLVYLSGRLVQNSGSKENFFLSFLTLFIAVMA